MKVRLFAMFVALFLAAGVCLAADKQISDDSISDHVRLRLASDPDVKGGALAVDVKNGVVTMGGTVETQHQKDKAAKLAKKAKGVKQVVNNIEIKARAGGK
jgi:osmotically-inducible protein OsmY